MNRPVIIRSYTGQLLRNQGDSTKFETEGSFPAIQADWIIYPKSDGTVIVKSLADQLNLQVLPEGRARVENANELLWEQFYIETNYTAPGSVFYLVSKHTGNVLHCSPEGLVSTQTQNKGHQEALQIYTRPTSVGSVKITTQDPTNVKNVFLQFH